MDPFKVRNIKRTITTYQDMIKHYEETLEREEKNLVKEQDVLKQWLATEYLLKNKEIRDKKELAHLKLVTSRGSKITKLIEWLQETIKKDKDNRFIVFSKVRHQKYEGNSEN